ncbi:MAG: hypothetical protein EOO72_00950, partial [Myxococcaceae bacterium]
MPPAGVLPSRRCLAPWAAKAWGARPRRRGAGDQGAHAGNLPGGGEGKGFGQLPGQQPRERPGTAPSAMARLECATPGRACRTVTRIVANRRPRLFGGYGYMTEHPIAH